jgi:general secretion pathway protein K
MALTVHVRSKRQRGVALITAILIVALATILATQIGFDSALEQRRSSAVLSLDQAFQVGLGAEAWAASYLKKDLDDGSKQDYPAERWATPIPPIPIDGGEVEGQVEDMQGRFNLNNLVTTEGAQNPEAIRQFRNLLAMLDLETKWADILADWLDADTQPTPDGAEDNVYTAQTPPYRAANGPITSVSELLALPDFGVDRYHKLRPYVAALPIGTKINLCSAPGIVIDALSNGTREFGLDEESLAKSRTDHCFPTPDDLRNAFHGKDFDTIANSIDDKTSYFRITALVTIGTSQMTMYSLLYRDEATHLIQPVMRTFSTD